MNKLFARILGVTVGFAMATGIGAGALLRNKELKKAEAADSSVATAVFNATNNQDSISSYTSTWTNITNGFSWTLENFNNNKTAEGGDGNWTYVKCGRKNNASVGTIATTNTVSNVITKVSITIDSFTSGKINSIKLYGGASASTEIGSYTVATGVKTVEIPAAKQGANQKYKVAFDCASGSSNGLLQLSKVELFEEASDVYPTSISCAAQSIDVLDTVDLSEKVVFTNSGGNTVTVKNLSYAVASGSNNIELDTTTGVVTGRKGGQATVTITAQTNGSGGTTSCTATINVSSIAVSPLTIGESYALYAVDEENTYEGELTGVSGNVGTVAAISNETPSCDHVLVVEEGYYENTVALKLGEVYLSYSGTSNQLKTENSVTATSSWKVTWDSNTNAAVVLNAANLARSLQFNYNGGSPRFACYTTTQVSVCLYHVVSSALTDFTIAATLDVYKTGKAQIAVTYTPADASDKSLTWASSNESIATVSSSGEVTGVAVGTCNVTATKVISGSTVVRTCVVTVLNNEAAHAGTSADPFNVNDAVNVAKGIFTAVKGGTAVNLDNYYYVEGMITKNVNRTTSTLTFWIGDEIGQNSAANGGFEIFKVAKVFGTDLGTYYTADSKVQEDFDVGHVVRASGKLVYYNNTTPEMNQGGYVYYNNYIEARVFAEDFIDGLEAVCDANGNTNPSNLATAWTNGQTAFAALDEELEQTLFAAADGKINGNTVEKCVAKYDYIISKYNTTSATTYADFMGRVSAGKITLQGSNNRLSLIGGSNNTVLIVVIAVSSLIALSSVGMFFIIRKRKEQR